MKRLLIALQFLTIIPIKNNMTINESNIARSSSVFVIVGFIQGLLLIVVDYISGTFFHYELVIGLILLALILSNGGFHLDGLADTFDALAAKSSDNIDKDVQRRLSIMRDSSIGPIGVIAIVFSVGLKYLALKSLSHSSYFTYYSSLLLMPILSKWTMVLSMFYGKPAREDGLGRLFISKVGFKEIAVSTLTLLLIFIGLQVFFKHYISDNQYIFYAILLVIMYFFCRISVNFFDKKFGGLTGDNLGAICEITEIIFLFMVIVWSQLFI